MITRDQFIATMAKIQVQGKRDADFSKALQEMGDGNFVFGTESGYLSALLELLKAEVHDTEGMIEWWLYEPGDDRTLTVQENGEEHPVDLTEPGVLYDFLLENTALIPFEKLPIREMEEDGKPHRFPRKVMDLAEFQACFESVLDSLKLLGCV